MTNQRGNMNNYTIENQNLLEKSREVKSGLGSVAWATLEMLKRGGMPTNEIEKLNEDMNNYFAKPSDDVCNTVLRVVEKRLVEDKEESGNWY
jgi:hypothetical protein